MKVTTAKALAECVDTPTVDRILPDPLDRTVSPRIARAVVKAAAAC